MLNIIMDYRMVPQLSALSLALCHEVLEGCGNHEIIHFIEKLYSFPFFFKVEKILMGSILSIEKPYFGKTI